MVSFGPSGVINNNYSIVLQNPRAEPPKQRWRVNDGKRPISLHDFWILFLIIPGFVSFQLLATLSQTAQLPPTLSKWQFNRNPQFLLNPIICTSNGGETGGQRETDYRERVVNTFSISIITDRQVYKRCWGYLTIVSASSLRRRHRRNF